MFKLFDRAFFRMAFQFLFIVMIAFGVLVVVGYLEVRDNDSLTPERSEAAVSGTVDF